MTMTTASHATPRQRRRTLGLAYLYAQAAAAALVALAVVAVLAARFLPPFAASTWSAVAARAHWPTHGAQLLVVAACGAALFGANVAATVGATRPDGYKEPEWLWNVSCALLLAGAFASGIALLVFVLEAFAPVAAPPAAFF